jgi:uncharacterized ferritin-like protein (DUF455 family)
LNLAEDFARIREALVESAPARKCERVAALTLPDGDFSAPEDGAPDFTGIPGRPQKPELILPRDVPKRGLGTPAGRAALAHAVAHIEFNAINLALDACWRFRQMPAQYYRDWLSVAQDEARHFTMLNARLAEQGYAYGDFPAHNGLWQAAEKTAHDVLVRMALVPRVLEARGLDVTPGIIERLEEFGDPQTAKILRVILDEEVRHVTIGTRWYRELCAQRGVEPDSTFKALMAEHRMRIHPPINRPARLLAGFAESELPPTEHPPGT